MPREERDDGEKREHRREREENGEEKRESRKERDDKVEDRRDDKGKERREPRREEEDGNREIKVERRDSEGSSVKERRRDDKDGRRERDDLGESRRAEIKDEPGEPSKARPRHTSRSDSEATNSQRGSSPEKQSLADRLMAISSNTGERESRGKWLTEQMEEYFDKKGNDQSGEPTEEEIKMQLKLPTKETVDKNEFKEPLTNWQPVENTGIPGWRKELLPEEEVMRPPDWKPPTPPRVDISLQQYKDEFKEESPKLPKINEIVQDKERILREDLDDNDEVVLYNRECIIRTTKAGIRRSKRDREEEEEEEEREMISESLAGQK